MQYCIDLFQADIFVQKATNINHSKWTAMQKKKILSSASKGEDK